MTRTKWVLAGLLATVLVLATIAAVMAGLAGRQFKKRYDSEKFELVRSAKPSPPLDATKLPPVIQRYVQVLGGADRPPIKLATLVQQGELRTAPDQPWRPFDAEQAYTFDPPAFMWFAKARVAPLVSLYARDKFVDGKGGMRISLLGLVAIADATGPELDRGAGLRFWGEVLAFPEMLTHPALQWNAIDDRRAKLTVTQGALVLEAEVEFDADGRLVAVHAERDASQGKTFVRTPWTGHFRAWRELGGRTFPTEWESEWRPASGAWTAVRMRVTAVRVE